MGRKTLDRLLAAGGLVVAAVLLVASGLLYWAHSFVDHEVHAQLAAQQIFFPAKGSESLADPLVKSYLERYAGEQLVNGTQAHAYADHSTGRSPAAHPYNPASGTDRRGRAA